MDSFSIGTEIQRTREKGFEARKRSIKSFSKIYETTLSTGVGIAITMVIPTIGCTWALSKSGGCSMCGYINDSTLDPETNPEYFFDLEWEKLQEDERFKKVTAVKLYNSGSFLDPNEIPVSSQRSIVKKIAAHDHIKEFVIECLPQIIIKQKNVLKELVSIFNNKPIYIGVGLESSNTYILRSYVNKPFTYENQFKKCVKIAEDAGAYVKPYLLLKPPFLTEKEAIEDAITTIRDAFDAGCEVVSLNPIAVHADTLVDKLWKQGNYSPPWLWSVLEVLDKAKLYLISSKRKLICEIMAGGLVRGPHNCGQCDTKVLKEIEYFSKQGKFSPNFPHLSCRCKSFWNLLYKKESFLSKTGAISDHLRLKTKNLFE